MSTGAWTGAGIDRAGGRCVVRRRLTILGAAAVLLATAGCESVPSTEHDALVEHMPRSILVLPPLNESIEIDASYSWLTTISQPLAERGYYVFPVAMVDAFMRENGLPGPEEMHAVPLARLDAVFDPDAVLYVVLEDFGQKFELLSSRTVVNARATLVDTDTGIELWNGEVRHSESSGSSGQGALIDLLGAAVAQAAGTVGDNSHAAAAMANRTLVGNDRGLLFGPLHPEFGTDHPRTPSPEAADEPPADEPTGTDDGMGDGIDGEIDGGSPAADGAPG